jgi:hypothetical protein
VPDEFQRLPMGPRAAGLVDLLDRILDKGLIVAGDVKISLADVELLTIRIRLLICSVDKAEKIGMDWWRTDPYFSSSAPRPIAAPAPAPALPVPAGVSDETRRLEARMQDIDAKLSALLKHLPGTSPGSTGTPGQSGNSDMGKSL